MELTLSVQYLFRSSFFSFFGGAFFSLHSNGKWCSLKGYRPGYHVLNLSLARVCMAKEYFLAFFKLTDTEIGVVIYMYLKHSTDYIDSMVKLLVFKCLC